MGVRTIYSSLEKVGKGVANSVNAASAYIELNACGVKVYTVRIISRLLYSIFKRMTLGNTISIPQKYKQEYVVVRTLVNAIIDLSSENSNYIDIVSGLLMSSCQMDGASVSDAESVSDAKESFCAVSSFRNKASWFRRRK